jgi:enoyl-CoA hydratase/carnithine racemase
MSNKIADDDPRVNPWGGAIALGHPLASSGVRLMIQLAREFGGQPAVGVTGKPFIFAVGADLSGAALIGMRDEALAIGRLGHAAFRRLGELGVPSFAFVNGAALGGGLELALHCSYRTISSGVSAVAFPECFIGLLSGWGGTYLLPRLIGPAGR